MRAFAIMGAAAGALTFTGSAAGAIPLGDVPPPPEPPAVLFPSDAGALTQATDAVLFAPHEGRIDWLFIATSPETTDQRFGRPPSPNPELANQVAILNGGGQGATRVPLSGWPRQLPAGRYWFNVMWTFQKTYEVCIVIVAPSGACHPDIAPIAWPVLSVRFTQPRSFVIPAIAAQPGGSVPTKPGRRQPVRPAECAGYRAALVKNAVIVRRAKRAVKVARNQPARVKARVKLKRATLTRQRLLRSKASACRLR